MVSSLTLRSFPPVPSKSLTGMISAQLKRCRVTDGKVFKNGYSMRFSGRAHRWKKYTNVATPAMVYYDGSTPLGAVFWPWDWLSRHGIHQLVCTNRHFVCTASTRLTLPKLPPKKKKGGGRKKAVGMRLRDTSLLSSTLSSSRSLRNLLAWVLRSISTFWFGCMLVIFHSRTMHN